jgi:hypothetical protein
LAAQVHGDIADLIDKIRLGQDSYLKLKEVRFAGLLRV